MLTGIFEKVKMRRSSFGEIKMHALAFIAARNPLSCTLVSRTRSKAILDPIGRQPSD
jgi:hypothetical protein